MDEFLILLQAKLDEAKSKNYINADIKKIQKNLDKLKLQAVIDSKTVSNITKQLEGILNQKITISNIKIDQGTGAKAGAQYGNEFNQGFSKSLQKNVAPARIFKTSDLRKNNIAYMTKASNTIDKQMDEIQKMANAKGWSDFKVQGFEEADGKITQLTLTVTEAEGAIKKLNFQREKLQGNGKAQDGLIQTGDVQIIKTAAQAQEELAAYTKKANDELANQITKIESSLDNGKEVSQYQNRIDKPINNFQKYGISVDETKVSFDQFAQPVSDDKAAALILQELNGGNISLSRWNQMNAELEKTEYQMSILGRIGKSFMDQMSEIGRNISSYLSISAAFMTMVFKTKEAVGELKEIDNILTEISKTSDLTSQELEKLGNTSFKTSGKYGKEASDYLIGIQEMFRAGFNNADDMAELSILAQSAGNLQRGTADDYLIATNAAYDLKGNIEKLNAVLDSQNYITNHTAVSMEDMAQATSEAASIAAQYGVQIDELSALTAVAVSKTRESGSEVGNALKNIFINLQDTAKKPILEVFDALDISMTKFVNDTEILKTPVELLKELSDAFVMLPEDSVLRSNILTDIGSNDYANTLAAILSDFDSYYEMLDLYSKGSGSAMDAAMKSANNLEGSLNRLGNTWTSIVNNVIDSDALINATNGFNSVLSVVEKLTSLLGSLGTISFGAGLLTSIKNVGRDKMYFLICYLF